MESGWGGYNLKRRELEERIDFKLGGWEGWRKYYDDRRGKLKQRHQCFEWKTEKRIVNKSEQWREKGKRKELRKQWLNNYEKEAKRGKVKGSGNN